MKNLWKLLLPFILISCTDKGSTLIYTTFINNTTHAISVKCYNEGSVEQGWSFNLNSHDSIIKAIQRGMGVARNVVYASFGEPNRWLDSIIVIFDNSYQITHYSFDSLRHNTNGYLYSGSDSSRNIFNHSSYKRIVVHKSKHYGEWNFEYIFTEQDYLDAKERGREVVR